MSEEINKNLEINKLVHEQVFKKCWHEKGERSLEVRNKFFCKKCGELESFIHVFNKSGESDICLANTEYNAKDITAFKILLEMEKQGFHFEISTEVEDYAPGYLVAVYKAPESKEYSQHRYLRHSICKAALSALGVEIK